MIAETTARGRVLKPANGKEKLMADTLQVDPPSSVSELPESRQAAWAQSMAMYQETAAQLDTMRIEVAKLKSDISGYKVALDAKDSIMADLESKVQTMQMVRDEAVAHRAKWEALFISVQAQLRAFQVPAAPFVKLHEETGDVEISQ